MLANQTNPIMVAATPKRRSLLGSRPTGTLPENAIKYSPTRSSADGPTMKPNKCPASLDGDDGTVQGESKSPASPKKARQRPNARPMVSLEESEIQTPKGTSTVGSQNQRAASAIASIRVALPLFLSKRPRFLYAVAWFHGNVRCGIPKYPTMVDRMLKVLLW